MSRATVVLIAIVALLLIALVGVASIDTEVAPARVEKAMLNGAGA